VYLDESNKIHNTKIASDKCHRKSTVCSQKTAEITHQVPWRNFAFLIIVFLLLMLLMVHIASLQTSTFSTNLSIKETIKVEGNSFSRNEFTRMYLSGLWKQYSDIIAPAILNFTNFTTKISVGELWDTTPFFTDKRGYLMALDVDISNNDLCVSISHMKGLYDEELPWPMSGIFIIELLNQNGNYGHRKKAFLLNNASCSECTKKIMRPGPDGLNSYGVNLASLETVIRNVQYHKNDNILIRVSYSSCYLCTYIEDTMLILPGCFAAFVLDFLSTLVLLAFIALCRNLQETSKAVFGLESFKVDSVLKDVMKDAFKSVLLLVFLMIIKIMVDMILGVSSVIEAYEFIVFVIWCFIERVSQVYLNASIVSVYLYKNRQCIIIRPFLLLLALIQMCSPFATVIAALTITVINTFAINIFDVLRL